jgi:hypothetical protein
MLEVGDEDFGSSVRLRLAKWRELAEVLQTGVRQHQRTKRPIANLRESQSPAWAGLFFMSKGRWGFSICRQRGSRFVRIPYQIWRNEHYLE